MRELSLFTGAGGGLLGTHLLGWEPCGYVEWNSYCQQVIAARIRDGYLPVAPIFTDVREFVQSGAAVAYRGVADVVTAGFPCQPHSVAGLQRGAEDERDMWPATAAVICSVQPEAVLLENVRGLISSGYIGTVLGDLAELGYVGRWGVRGAADAGAPHQRDRVWILAHACGSRLAQRIVLDGHLVAPRSAPWREAPELGGSWWESDPGNGPEPGMGRVANGVADRVERIKALGNGQVPAVVRRAWQELAA